MHENRFKEIMENWASQESESVPQLRPKKEMYQRIKAKTPKMFFPVFTRWATVGVAVVAVVVAVIVLRPEFFHAPKSLEQSPGKDTPSVEMQRSEEGERDVSAPMERKDRGEELKRKADMLEVATVDSEGEPSVALLKEEAQNEMPAPADKNIVKQPLPSSAAEGVPGETFAPSPTGRTAKSRAAFKPAEESDVSLQSASTQPAEREFSFDALADNDEALTPALSVVGEETTGEQQQIGSKIFRREDDIWIDTDHTQGKEIIKIKRNSQAYHQIVTVKPDLKSYFDHYQNMIVNIGTYSIELTDDGKTELTEAELKTLLQAE
jgi:hypothetical protein